MLDAVNNRTLVVDSSLDAIISVDLANGNRSIISDTNTSVGPKLLYPTSIGMDVIDDRALILDRGLDAVIRVNLTPVNAQ